MKNAESVLNCLTRPSVQHSDEVHEAASHSVSDALPINIVPGVSVPHKLNVEHVGAGGLKIVSKAFQTQKRQKKEIEPPFSEYLKKSKRKKKKKHSRLRCSIEMECSSSTSNRRCSRWKISPGPRDTKWQRMCKLDSEGEKKMNKTQISIEEENMKKVAHQQQTSEG